VKWKIKIVKFTLVEPAGHPAFSPVERVNSTALGLRSSDDRVMFNRSTGYKPDQKNSFWVLPSDAHHSRETVDGYIGPGPVTVLCKCNLFVQKEIEFRFHHFSAPENWV
jgi:hypothetical protein